MVGTENGDFAVRARIEFDNQSSAADLLPLFSDGGVSHAIAAIFATQHSR